MDFNPLRPRGRRPKADQIAHFGHVISTHSAREDGDQSFLLNVNHFFISTHSAREDGDLGFTVSQSMSP